MFIICYIMLHYQVGTYNIYIMTFWKVGTYAFIRISLTLLITDRSHQIDYLIDFFFSKITKWIIQCNRYVPIYYHILSV